MDRADWLEQWTTMPSFPYSTQQGTTFSLFFESGQLEGYSGWGASQYLAESMMGIMSPAFGDTRSLLWRFAERFPPFPGLVVLTAGFVDGVFIGLNAKAGGACDAASPFLGKAISDALADDGSYLQRFIHEVGAQLRAVKNPPSWL